MQQNDLERKAESIALSTYLSWYPNDRSYEDICEMLVQEDRSGEVSVWFVFEEFPIESVLGWMNCLRDTIINEFKGE